MVLHLTRMSHFSPAPERLPTWLVPPTSPGAAMAGISCKFGWGNGPETYLGSPLRVSLRTGDFEARRRLVDNLGWVQELIEAPDLEALGTVVDARLPAYADRGAPTNERLLAERCAFEHGPRSAAMPTRTASPA